jgi:hypothetical protein
MQVSQLRHRARRFPAGLEVAETHPFSLYPQLPDHPSFVLEGRGWGQSSAFRLLGFRFWLGHLLCGFGKNLSLHGFPHL